MTTSGLLDDAARILDGEVDLGARGPRVVAVLTRSAFEGWLDWVCEPWLDSRIGRPSTRSKLIVVKALYGGLMGDQAGRIWDGLSRACHQQAYVMQPSVAEVRSLHAATNELLSTRIARQSGSTAPVESRIYLEENVHA